MLPGSITGCGSPAVAIQLTGNSLHVGSTDSFDFGSTVVSQRAIHAVVTVTNTGTDPATLTAKLNGDSRNGRTDHGWKFAGYGHRKPNSRSLHVSAEKAGSFAVEFGTDTSYGRMTGSVATPANLGPVSILVAGMQQNMTYHMRALLTASDGTVSADSDHTFTTTSFPAGMLPTISTTTASGQTPQPGIELANAAASSTNGNYLEAYATDCPATSSGVTISRTGQRRIRSSSPSNCSRTAISWLQFLFQTNILFRIKEARLRPPMTVSI